MQERLRELRLQMGRTQQEMADLLNITSSAYSLYETGKRQLNYESLLLLADYFDVSLDYLFGRSSVRKLPVDFTLTDQRLLKQYHSLDSRGKKALQALLEFEAKQENNST